MKEVASTGHDLRESSLVDLGKLIASTPYNMDELRRSMEEVKRVGGMELMVEAAAVCGAFECMTKIVDATQRRQQHQGLLRFMKVVITLLKHRATICLLVVVVCAILTVKMMM